MCLWSLSDLSTSFYINWRHIRCHLNRKWPFMASFWAIWLHFSCACQTNYLIWKRWSLTGVKGYMTLPLHFSLTWRYRLLLYQINSSTRSWLVGLVGALWALEYRFWHFVAALTRSGCCLWRSGLPSPSLLAWHAGDGSRAHFLTLNQPTFKAKRTSRRTPAKSFSILATDGRWTL